MTTTPSGAQTSSLPSRYRHPRSNLGHAEARLEAGSPATAVPVHPKGLFTRPCKAVVEVLTQFPAVTSVLQPSGRHAQRHPGHAAEDHRVEPFEARLGHRKLDARPALEHRRQGDLAFQSRQGKAEADVHAEAEGQVRHSVALEDEAIGILIGS